MYRAPLKDLGFVLHRLIDESALMACAPFSDYSPELADTILEEAGKFAENVLEPLYKSADREGAKWTPEGVRTPKGFIEAYRQYVDGGWPALRASPEFGGQGAPTVLGTAVEELWASANLAFKLCPMLTQGAWHGHPEITDGFKSSQQAYDTLHIGDPKQAQQLQAKARK